MQKKGNYVSKLWNVNVYFTDQNTMQVELNFKVLEIQRHNILTDRTQREKIDEKNRVICFVIMFTPSYGH